MKKVLCVLVAFLIGLVATAAAESVPSKSTEDMTQFNVISGSIPKNSTFYIRPSENNDADYGRRVEICQKEIDKMMEAGNLVDYFGDVKNNEGQEVSLFEMLGTSKGYVYEVFPVVVGDYSANYGDLEVSMKLSTPYQANEKLVVMLGFVTVRADGTQHVEWIAYDATSISSIGGDGEVLVKLDSKTIEGIQNETVLMAILSK